MKVSVLINNYNYGRFLEETINSVLNQTYDNIEIILYDDGSTDNSNEVFHLFKDKIKIISQPNFKKHPSQNQAHAIEEAFKISTGEIMFLLDSDDLFHKDKVARVVEEFSKDENIICVQHPFKLINEKSELLNKSKRPTLSGVSLPETIYFTGRLDFFFTQTSGLAFRRSFMSHVLPFETDSFLKLWPDLRLTRNAVFFGKIIMLNEYLGFYRLHGKNDSDKLSDKRYLSEFEREQLEFFNILAKKYNKPKLKLKNKWISIVLILFKLFSSNVNFSKKINFFREFYNNKFS